MFSWCLISENHAVDIYKSKIRNIQTDGRGPKTRGPRWSCIAHLITRQVWVNWPFGSREEFQYWFLRWRPSWISNQNDFSYFWSTSHLDTSNEVWVNCPLAIVDAARRTIQDGYWLATIAYLEHFVLRWANKWDVIRHSWKVSITL